MEVCLFCHVEMELFRDHGGDYWKCPRCQEVVFINVNRMKKQVKKKKIRKELGED